MARTAEEAIRLASDPSTPLGVLYELAQEHPEVHATLAANPSTYPDLLAWLASLGRDDVDAALRARGLAPLPAASDETTVMVQTSARAEEISAVQAQPIVTPIAAPNTPAVAPELEVEPELESAPEVAPEPTPEPELELEATAAMPAVELDPEPTPEPAAEPEPSGLTGTELEASEATTAIPLSQMREAAAPWARERAAGSDVPAVTSPRPERPELPAALPIPAKPIETPDSESAGPTEVLASRSASSPSRAQTPADPSPAATAGGAAAGAGVVAGAAAGAAAAGAGAASALRAAAVGSAAGVAGSPSAPSGPAPTQAYSPGPPPTASPGPAPTEAYSPGPSPTQAYSPGPAPTQAYSPGAVPTQAYSPTPTRSAPSYPQPGAAGPQHPGQQQPGQQQPGVPPRTSVFAPGASQAPPRTSVYGQASPHAGATAPTAHSAAPPNWQYGGNAPQPAYPMQQAGPAPTYQPQQAAYPSAPAGSGYYGTATPQAQAVPKRKVPLAAWIAIGAGAALLVLAVIWFLSQMNKPGDPNASMAASPSAIATVEATEEPTVAETTPAPESSDAVDLAGAAAALTTASTSTMCADVGTDAAAIVGYQTAASDAGVAGSEEVIAATRAAVVSIQERCNARYATTVASEAFAQDSTLSDLVTTTDWVVPVEGGPAGASALGAFETPSGNIACTVSESGATCTIREYDFAAPEGCSAGSPVTLTVDASGSRTDCGATVNSGGGNVLQYGSASQVGDFVCTSAETGVRCWDTLSGASLSMARAAGTTAGGTLGSADG